MDIKKTIITRQPGGDEEEIEEMYTKTFLGEVLPSHPALYQVSSGEHFIAHFPALQVLWKRSRYSQRNVMLPKRGGLAQAP